MNSKNQLKNCTLCTLSSNAACLEPLGGTGRGTKFMLLTLAPTWDEDNQRKHYPNDEGVLLEKMLNCVGLTMREFYATTLIKCRTEFGHKPSKFEISTCSSAWFKEELQGIKLILGFGGELGKAILGDKFSITKGRGLYMYEEVPIFLTYHPRYLLRFPSLEVNSPKWQSWQDLIAFKDYVNNGVPF